MHCIFLLDGVNVFYPFVMCWSRQECLVSTSTPTRILRRLLAGPAQDKQIAKMKQGSLVLEGGEVAELEGGVVVLLLDLLQSWKGSPK